MKPNFASFLHAIAISLFLVGTVSAQPLQTQADTFTRYELLAPSSQSFRIYYDVSATTEGARFYYNPIRRGSEPDVHGVYDRMSGAALTWELVGGDDAAASGLLPDAEAQDEYIKVHLTRPVPANGRGRMLIDKTYMDARSYYQDGDVIVFKRTLGIKRNAVILPHGYELIGVNYPSQVMTLEDGRIQVSFINPGTIGVPYEVKARPLIKSSSESAEIALPDLPMIQPDPRPIARTDDHIPERASQNRDIVYFLQAPDTHSFRLYHDYTETRPGTDKYLNVVRTGSKASNPSAYILDTGEVLKVETLRGAEITAANIDIGEAVTADTELVVIWFDAVAEGASTRLRIEETYTDANRYFPASSPSGPGFIWDRSFGRSANTVVLPYDHYLSANAVPATVQLRDDGRVSLRYINERPGNIDVYIRGTRR